MYNSRDGQPGENWRKAGKKRSFSRRTSAQAYGLFFHLEKVYSSLRYEAPMVHGGLKHMRIIILKIGFCLDGDQDVDKGR